MPNRRSWTLADVLDFEALLHADEGSDPEVLYDRDHRLFRDHISQSLPESEAQDRSTIFRRWLEARRASDKTLVSPGTWLMNGLRALGAISATSGIVLGFSTGVAALYYSGTRPVNVAVFLAVTVCIQWVLILWALIVWISKGFRQSAGRALVRLASSVGTWLAGATDHLPGEERMRVRGQAAALRNLAGRNGELLRWPPVVALQGFGIAWNVGVLLALLLRVVFTDVAFGWESTWARGPEAAHSIAQALATPWTWFAPHACPTLEQVRQSWFQYLAGVGALNREATISWSPWLMGMIIVYGLLVRVGLFVFARASLARALQAVDFREPRHLEPWLRIGGRVIEGDRQKGDQGPVPQVDELATMARSEAAPGCVLIDRSLGHFREVLNKWVEQRLGWKVIQSELVEADFPSGNEQALQTLSSNLNASPRWVIFVPAPYTAFAATAQFLEMAKAREPNGSKVERGVVVVSRDEKGEVASPSPEWSRYWRDFLRTESPDMAFIDWRQS
ncbi:MAG TPA: DUF2868 domain-containing protein [Chthoniobacteraceae bacterium]|nr:DUF2868 domain-containing protein [Chthoniobacteraceae bacterium]